MYTKLTSAIAFSLLLLVSLSSASMLILESKSAAWAQSTTQDQKSQADNLLKQAKQHLETRQYLKAFKTYQQALTIYQQLKNLQGEAEALNGKGISYNEQEFNFRRQRISEDNIGYEHFDNFFGSDAEKCFKQALAIAKKIGDQRIEAESLLGLGIAHHIFGDQTIKAIENYKQALVISNKIGDRQLEGRIIRYLGFADDSDEYLKKASAFHQQSIAIAKQIGDRKGEAFALKELCVLHEFPFDYSIKLSLSQTAEKQLSLKYCQRSLDIFSQIKDVPNTFYILYKLTSNYKDLIGSEQGIKYHQQILLLAQQTGDLERQETALTNIGDIYDELGQYQKALDFYQQALKFESPVLKPAIGMQNYGLYSLYKSIGRSYSNLKQYALSIDYYTRSLDIAKYYDKNNKDNVKSVAFTKNHLLYSLGEAYYAQGKYQQAIDNYQESLSIYKSERDLEMQGTILWALGSSYFALANYQQAIASFQESIAIFKKLNLPSDLAILLSNLGNSYFAIEQYQKAIDAYRESLMLKKQLGDRKGALELLANIDDAMKALEKQKTKP